MVRERDMKSEKRVSTREIVEGKVERKEIERKRRQHLKELCTRLASLIPDEHYPCKHAMTQQGSLDEAADYIKKLKERVEELKKKVKLELSERGGAGATVNSTLTNQMTNGGLPMVKVYHHGDASLDVALISTVQKPFKFHELITVLEEEGAEIVSANFSIISDKIFYTIHSRAFCSRIGIEASSVYERLRTLI